MAEPVRFRPKARIMVLLGDQLIKNHTLALFELIKNAYDADSTAVTVKLKNIGSSDGSIEVVDNGTGMTEEVVTKIWMEPAHGHKAEARNNKQRTKRGRLPVGEKGVGRFAAHRLGTVITMVTRAENQDEIFLQIDWDEFLKHDYLDQATIKIVTRAPEVFTSTNTGTLIKISKLRQEWKRGDVRKLYRAVSSMTPPDLFDSPASPPPKKAGDSAEIFAVNFSLEPENNWLDGLFDPALAISQALFEFNFELTDEKFIYSYKFKPYEAIKADYPNLIVDRTVLNQEIKTDFDFFKLAPAEDGIGLKQRPKRLHKPRLGPGTPEDEGLGIGPIRGTILGFDFDREIYDRYLKDESDGLATYLREQGGIRVYRDGLRVYNYGEPSDDWLHLDHRRIQGPTKRLGSRQLIGTIHISLEESPKLIEKTNREGFVDNEAYAELVHAMLCVLTQFEAERNKDKRTLKDTLTLPPGINQQNTARKFTVDELLSDLESKITSETAYQPLIPIVKEVTRAYQETRDVLMSAAGAGMGLVTVFHELERGIRNLHQAIADGTSPSTLEIMSEELVSLLRGAMYMVNTKEVETILASRLVENVMLTQGRRLKRHGITFLNGFEVSPAQDFEIHGIRRMLTTTLVNLLDNAIYWTDNDVEKQKFIWIGPSHNLEGPAIAIADSGIGLLDSAIDVIQPFFTRKTGGMGIGLFYADMVMKTQRGRLAFPDKNAVDRPKVTDGACVAMVFKKEGDK